LLFSCSETGIEFPSDTLGGGDDGVDPTSEVYFTYKVYERTIFRDNWIVIHVELDDNSELFKTLNLDNYKFRPERMMVFHIEAYDWNCPQHITPRYTTEEVEAAFLPQQKYIASLEHEIRELK
tara:strand:- start:612 stop:980 length:369 start_codon:yes stop_codon:yes gene_type:complete